MNGVIKTSLAFLGGAVVVYSFYLFFKIVLPFLLISGTMALIGYTYFKYWRN